jgi:hypothetical protein
VRTRTHDNAGTHAQVEDWPAMRRWAMARPGGDGDEAGFVAALGADGPLRVHVSDLSAVRMHSVVQPMGSLPGLEWHRPWRVHLLLLHHQAIELMGPRWRSSRRR